MVMIIGHHIFIYRESEREGEGESTPTFFKAVYKH